MYEFIKKLQSIGLTKNESRVYLFLIEYKEAKTGFICSKLNIPSSHIYGLLDKLMNKGIINYKIVNNVKVFRPVDPESLYSLFREKERKIETEKKELKFFISNLKKIEVKETKLNDFKYFEGINGVRSMFTEFINSWEKNSTVYVASAPIAYDKWNAFLLDLWHPVRKNKNIKQQLIVPSRLKKHGRERVKFKPIEVRYSDMENESEFAVAGDYTYLLSYGDNPYALLIKDKNFAKTQTRVFELMWGQASLK